MREQKAAYNMTSNLIRITVGLISVWILTLVLDTPGYIQGSEEYKLFVGKYAKADAFWWAATARQARSGLWMRSCM